MDEFGTRAIANDREDVEEKMRRCPPPLLGEERNWAELPGDVVQLIFLNLGAFLVMVSAQWVCRSWHEVSRDPHAWLIVDMGKNVPISKFQRFSKMRKVAMAAIACSNGLMEELKVAYIRDDRLNNYVASRPNRLKTLFMIACYKISDEALINLAKRSPMLETLLLFFCPLSGSFVPAFLKSCPQLKLLLLNSKFIPNHRFGPRRNSWFERNYHSSPLDLADALINSDRAYELRYLLLLRSSISNDELCEILDRCRKLETLVLCGCFNLTIDDSLRKRCERIRNLKLS